MSALPTAGWESRSPRAWRFTAAVILLLGGFAAALLVAGSAPRPPPGFGALFAVADMLQASVVAGAGLLGASWKGLGLVLDKMLASPAEPRRLRLPGALPQPVPGLADPPQAAGQCAASRRSGGIAGRPIDARREGDRRSPLHLRHNATRRRLPA